MRTVGKYIFHEYIYEYESTSQKALFYSGQFNSFSSFLGGTLIKRVYLDTDTEKSETEHEVKVIRELCGVERANFSTQRVCKHDFVADFYGCVVDKKAAYLFVRSLEKDFYPCHIKSSIIVHARVNRVLIMLEIIDLFIGLHRIGYVHGDIKPENILGSFARQDLRMVGFKYTNKVGEKFLGGTAEYLAPERRLKGSTAAGLTYKEDIYSLAMTLAKLEGYSNTNDDFLSKECLENKDTLAGCRKDFENSIKKVFPDDRNLSSLIPIFKKALSFNPDDRYNTLEEFSSAILEEFVKLDGAENTVKQAIEDELKIYPNGKSLDYWKCKAITKTFSSYSVARLVLSNNIKNEEFKKLCEKKKNANIQI